MKPMVSVWWVLSSILIWILSWQVYFSIAQINSCNSFGGDGSLIACSLGQLLIGSFMGAVRATIFYWYIFISILVVTFMCFTFLFKRKQKHF